MDRGIASGIGYHVPVKFQKGVDWLLGPREHVLGFRDN